MRASRLQRQPALVNRLIVLLLAIFLTACRGGTGPPLPSASSTATRTQPEPPTLTPVPPSPTPVQLIARVNGEPITLAAYQAELDRLEAALGTQLATEDEQGVLDDLIHQVLLAQAAADEGFIVDETLLQERYDLLVEGIGGVQAMDAWITANGYTQEGFRQDLARSIAAAWMRDQIIAGIEDVAEHVHARQILLDTPEEAEQVLADLGSGDDFADLATTYNPQTGGDLGWFPRGYLIYPELEQVAFSLQDGEYSQVIETPAGYHILQVIERDAQRLLDPGARLALQALALEDWLAERRQQSDIEILDS